MEKGSCSATPDTGACGAGPEKGKCCAKLIKGALLGGLIIWAWFALSWHVIPWHANSLMGFKDEKVVADALTKSAPDSGVYVLPFTNMGKEEQKTDKPFAFVSVYAPGVNVKDSMPSMMIGAFVMSVVMAGFLSCLLTKKVDGFCPVAFSMKVGLLAGIAAHLPNYLFYHFPLSWTLTGVADQVIAFALAGAVISKCVLKLKLGMCPASACPTTEAKCGDNTDKK
jgi:hypothetical protein